MVFFVSNINGSLRDTGFGRAVIFSVASCEIRSYAIIFIRFGFIAIFIFSWKADINTARTRLPLGFVFQIAPSEGFCTDFIFIFASFTGDDCTFKIGVSTYFDIKAALTCIDTGLFLSAFIFWVDFLLAIATGDSRSTSCTDAADADIPIGLFFMIVIRILEGLDMEKVF